MLNKRAFLTTAFLLLYVCILLGQHICYLNEVPQGKRDLSAYTYIFEDVTNQLSVKQISSDRYASDFQLLDHSFHILDSDVTYWLRISIENLSENTNWILSIGTFEISASIYLLGDGIYKQFEKGFDKNSSGILKYGISIAGPLTINKNENTEVFVQLHKVMNFPYRDISPRLYERETWDNFLGKRLFLFGTYSGILWMALFVSLIIFIVHRFKESIYYALYIVTIIISSSVLENIYFPFETLSYNVKLLWILAPILGYGVFYIRLLQSLLQLNKYKKLNLFLTLLMIGNALFFLFAFLNKNLNNYFMYQMYMGSIIFNILVIASVAFFIYHMNQNRISGIIFIGMLSLLITVVLQLYNVYTDRYYFLYTVVLLGILVETLFFGYAVIYRYFLLEQEKIQHFITEKVKITEEKDRIASIVVARNQFITNVSHELKTPITLIIGAADTLYIQSKNIYKRYTNTIKTSANRLLYLVNELLDLSKIESGNYELKLSEQPVIPVVNKCFQFFLSDAAFSNKNYTFQTLRDDVTCWFDVDLIEKVVTNLISNAFKYTKKGDSIIVSIDYRKVHEFFGSSAIKIVIEDTGIGIDKTEQQKIFNRYYSANSNKAFHSSGIGLALVKELVDIHDGRIELNSELGKGSMFIVTIPVNRNYYNEKQIPYVNIEYEEMAGNLSVDHLHEKESRVFKSLDIAKEMMLIVEDDNALMEYLVSNFKDEYFVISAYNANEGFKKAIKFLPDTIITDIKMPDNDGFEFCKNLKNDERTKNIPVTLLTVKDDIKSKVRGLELGAEDYITKPFDIKELKLRIKNQLLRRKQVSKSFNEDARFHEQIKQKLSNKIEVISKLNEYLTSHVSDPDISIDELCKKVNMSRSVFYRYIKSLTGYSPNAYIMSFRLKHSIELLKQGLEVSEAAYASGFNNHSYFSKMFKQYIGVSPTDFLKGNSYLNNE